MTFLHLFPAPRHVAVAALAGVLVVAGCASSGPNSSSARPVLYPNAALNRVGEAQARHEADDCMARAAQAGLTPEVRTHAVGRRAGEGAAIGGVASTVGALITGRGAEGMIRSGAAGAAVGGSAGAVSGAFHNDQPNGVYRSYVQRCLKDKGFDVIGWN